MRYNESHIFTGMQRDLSVSKHPILFIYDGRNIRLTAREGDSLLSIVNEKGTMPQLDNGQNPSLICVIGTYLGHCLLNEYLVVFSTTSFGVNQGYDYITRINLTDFSVKMLFNGEGSDHKTLNFSTEYPIEARGSFETDNIQKIYWTDGNNLPRMINIAPLKDDIVGDYTSRSFDFVQLLDLNEIVTVRKTFGTGEFLSGVILYAFTYYNKYGQESCIFYTTPLYYISNLDRGGSPDKILGNVFEITIRNVDTIHFDYVRIYSIHRTSINGTPIVKRILDIQISEISNSSAIYVDTGLSGDTIDPTELLYKGGEVISAETLDLKDGTLFLGNITIKRLQLIKELESYINTTGNQIKSQNITSLNTVSRPIYVSSAPSVNYPYGNLLTAFNSSEMAVTVPCGGFKTGETYRLGVQFQANTGQWSEPFWILDYKISKSITVDNNSVVLPNHSFQGKLEIINLPAILCTINKALSDAIKDCGYIKARPIVVFPNIHDRHVLTLCVGCPTVYTNDKKSRGILGQSSWFFRPFIQFKGTITVNDGENNQTNITVLGADYDKYVLSNGTVSPKSDYDGLAYIENNVVETTDGLGFIVYQWNPKGYSVHNLAKQHIRQVEIQGQFDDDNKFKINWYVLNLHSPDVQFDEYFQVIDYEDIKCFEVGSVLFGRTLSDIELQTETPTISRLGTGFVHRSFASNHSFGIVSGLFYDDFAVDDNQYETIEGLEGYGSSSNVECDLLAYLDLLSSFKWMVYPWQRSGSLTNDINRLYGYGTSASVLKKKIISNLRFAETRFTDTELDETNNDSISDYNPVLFSSDEVTVVKVPHYEAPRSYTGYDLYYGNIDTLLIPDAPLGAYFAFNSDDTALDPTVWNESDIKNGNINTNFNCDFWYKLDNFKVTINNPFYGHTPSNPQTISQDVFGIFKFAETNSMWYKITDDIGNIFPDLCSRKDSIRMKYKSTPHLVLDIHKTVSNTLTDNRYPSHSNPTPDNYTLPIYEIWRHPVNSFGGTTLDALIENTWIPCGRPVKLGYDVNTNQATGNGETIIRFEYGDTYFQRWDCLKTYPFTPEDINQIVEIGSFMLETRINIDGRYDKNRGQLSNINMSPLNFNLLNPIYSQLDNFFNYKIMDKDFYNNINYPNQITWTLEKQPAADIDLWTNITLASTYNLDGSKGSVKELINFNDQIYCFLSKGISKLLFNSRVQISTSDGVPIEVSNNYKMEGSTYMTDGIGCDDKLLVKKTPNGLYFIDSTKAHLYTIGENILDLSTKLNMSSYFKNCPLTWKKLCYDSYHSDLYLVNSNESMCYSETLGLFTGFYDYDDISLIESYNHKVFTMRDSRLWRMFAGRYNHIFGINKPWNFTFVCNGLLENTVPLDKIFTNLEFRVSMENDGLSVNSTYIDPEIGLGPFDYTFDYTFHPEAEQGEQISYNSDETIILPVDYLETWNEYQHGVANLKDNRGHRQALHHTVDNEATLKKKFRIWRCDIPRDNADVDVNTERKMGISRVRKHSNDRMRNPWLFIKLEKEAAEPDKYLTMTELHDVITSYYR